MLVPTYKFYYIKVGCKGVYITRTCFHDVFNRIQIPLVKAKLSLLPEFLVDFTMASSLHSVLYPTYCKATFFHGNLFSQTAKLIYAKQCTIYLYGHLCCNLILQISLCRENHENNSFPKMIWFTVIWINKLGLSRNMPFEFMLYT